MASEKNKITMERGREAAKTQKVMGAGTWQVGVVVITIVARFSTFARAETSDKLTICKWSRT